MPAGAQTLGQAAMGKEQNRSHCHLWSQPTWNGELFGQNRPIVSHRLIRGSTQPIMLTGPVQISSHISDTVILWGQTGVWTEYKDVRLPEQVSERQL